MSGCMRYAASSSVLIWNSSASTHADTDKIGRDAADLCGLDRRTGVLATDDIDALIALNADCVVYTSQAETRPHDALAEMSPIPAGGHECRWDVVRLAGGARTGRRLAARAAGTGVFRGRYDVVHQRNRPGVLRRHPGLHRAEPDGPGDRNHRAGDLRLRHLRRRRIHRRQFRFRDHAGSHADNVLARCSRVDVGRAGAQPGRRSRHRTRRGP